MDPSTRTSGVPRLLAVDGNSLGHRAYHSIRADTGGDLDPGAGRRGVAGGPTTADPDTVAGAVVSMVASTWRHGPYDAVAVAFDHPVNRRKLDDPDYKSNRPTTEPALVESLQRLRRTLEDTGIAVLEHDGAEADDLLVATVDGCAARGWPCDLLSSDRDLLALVDEDVRLLRPRARFAELTVEDLDSVRGTYGIEPHQYPDLAALRGDPSDGLEGVPGIGPKTAARLIRAHGSVVGVYEALSDLPPRIEAALRAARERVERNVLLMAPLPHLVVDVDDIARRGVDLDRIEAALDARGQSAAARRLRRAIADPLPPRPPPPLEPPTSSATDPREPVRGPAVTAPAAYTEQAALFDEA
jgi:DNA polymerase I